MIRPFTCLCMMLAAGSGMYLYQEKHRSQVLDEQIVKVLNAADANRERVRVLRAEYQLLQDPTRMEDLANQHLALVKIDPRQFVNWAGFEKNFPVVAAPPTAVGAPVEEPPAVGPAAEPPPVPAPGASAAPMARAEPPRLPLNPIAMAARAAAMPMPPLSGGAISAARAVAQTQPAAASPPAQAAPLVVASATPSMRGSAAGPRGEPPAIRSEIPAAVHETASAASGRSGAAGPSPQRVALTLRRPTYGGNQGGDGADRFGHGLPTEPASTSALGMARMLPTPTFVAPPPTQPIGNGG